MLDRIWIFLRWANFKMRTISLDTRLLLFIGGHSSMLENKSCPCFASRVSRAPTTDQEGPGSVGPDSKPLSRLGQGLGFQAGAQIPPLEGPLCE